MAGKTGCQRLIMGSFDSEKFWKDDNFSTLPTFYDHQTDAIVSVMDEMQFVFCENRNDILLTRFPINNYFKEYLNYCEFDFLCNSKPIKDCDENIIKNKNIFQLIEHPDNVSYLKNIIPNNSVLTPYSVLPKIETFCKQFNINEVFPELVAIKKVNSKLYSFDVTKKVLNCSCGHIVHSSGDLQSLGDILLKKDIKFLIKDPFGVSGKGIIPVNSFFLLKRLCQYLKTQEIEGKETLFLIEPILDKDLDFSCQIEIATNGCIEFVSSHINDINGFKHSKCRYLDKSFLKLLENKKYYEKIELIGKQLFKDSYTGPACIDSMRLADGSIRIVVEINARKSMTLFHHFVRKKFPFALDSLMIQIYLIMQKKIGIEEFLNLLQKGKLLFNIKRGEGILPLSGNALIINNVEGELPYKAALFAIIVSSGYLKTESIFKSLKELLIKNNISIV